MFVVFLSISRTCDVTSATFNGFAPTLLKFQQVSEYHRLFCRPNDKNNKYTHKKGCRLIKTNEAEDKKVDIWSGAVRITSDMNPAFPRSRGEVQHKGSRQRKQAVATICYRYISRSLALPRGHYAPATSNVISSYAINPLTTNESIQITPSHPVSKPSGQIRNKKQDIKIHSTNRCYFLYIRRHVVTLPRDASGLQPGDDSAKLTCNGERQKEN